MPAGSRDRWPEDYERGRPGWAPKVIELVGLPHTAAVLDLGAGTGKLTRMLTTSFDRVVAVEPAEAMRRLLVAHCHRAETPLLGEVRSRLTAGEYRRLWKTHVYWTRLATKGENALAWAGVRSSEPPIVTRIAVALRAPLASA